MTIRIYLDFDGTLTALNPKPDHGETITIDGEVMPVLRAKWLDAKAQDENYEIIWATHREEDVHHFMNMLNSQRDQARITTPIPTFPHLTFTDPTGSKVKDIIAHRDANPCQTSIVIDDALTDSEIKELTAAKICVLEFDNAIHVKSHFPEAE